jgi:hypothetical protein
MILTVVEPTWNVIPDQPESRNAEAALRRPRALLTKQQGD